MSVHVVRNGVKESFETLVSGRIGEIASEDLDSVRSWPLRKNEIHRLPCGLAARR
jgi:hypothetical protein